MTKEGEVKMRDKVRWVRPCLECYTVTPCGKENNDEINEVRRASKAKDVKLAAERMAGKFPERKFVPDSEINNFGNDRKLLSIPAKVPEPSITNDILKLQEAMNSSHEYHRKWIENAVLRRK